MPLSSLKTSSSPATPAKAPSGTARCWRRVRNRLSIGSSYHLSDINIQLSTQAPEHPSVPKRAMCVSGERLRSCSEPIADSSQLQGLLLRHTVHRAEAPDQISRVDAHNLAIWEKVGENIERNAVVRIVKNRHEDNSVRNIKIRVACWQAAFFKNYRSGHGQLDNR